MDVNVVNLIRLVEMDDEDVAMFLEFCALVAQFEEQIRVEDAGLRIWVRMKVNVNEWRFLNDRFFKMNFRMTSGTFEDLLNVVGNHLVERGKLGKLLRRRTSLDHILYMVLWILAINDTFRSVAKSFGTSPGVVHFHYVYIIEALRELAAQFIRWPGPDERRRIVAEFMRKTNFPGVVGAIDTTHCYISAPIEQPNRYINRHHSHSVVAQAVCDDRMLILDLYVGEPGSMHDARIYRRSPLSHQLMNNLNMMSPDEHVLGDAAYVTTQKILSPFRDNGHLTRLQKNFNYVLSQNRSIIERAFALLKGKFRRIKDMLSFNMEYLIDHIVAVCVLHNFLILHGEISIVRREVFHNDDEDEDYEDEEFDDHALELNLTVARGELKRFIIARDLYARQEE